MAEGRPFLVATTRAAILRPISEMADNLLTACVQTAYMRDGAFRDSVSRDWALHRVGPVGCTPTVGCAAPRLTGMAHVTNRPSPRSEGGRYLP